MPKTVAQEMSAAERRTRLLHGLRASGSEEVVVVFSHVAHALESMKQAEELTSNLKLTQGIIPSKFSRSTKMQSDATCEVDRELLIEALVAKEGSSNKAEIDKKIKK